MILPLSNSLVSHESVCLFVMFVSVRTELSICVKFLEMFSKVAFFFSIFSVAKQTSFELLLLVGNVNEFVELLLFSLPLPAPLPVVWLLMTGAVHSAQNSGLAPSWGCDESWSGTDPGQGRSRRSGPRRPEPELTLTTTLSIYILYWYPLIRQW